MYLAFLLSKACLRQAQYGCQSGDLCFVLDKRDDNAVDEASAWYNDVEEDDSGDVRDRPAASCWFPPGTGGQLPALAHSSPLQPSPSLVSLPRLPWPGCASAACSHAHAHMISENGFVGEAHNVSCTSAAATYSLPNCKLYVVSVSRLVSYLDCACAICRGSGMYNAETSSARH